MPKFMMLYVGPATPPSEMEPDAVQEEMKLWQQWMEDAGDAIVEQGAPTYSAGTVSDDGSDVDAVEVTGYTMIQADDLGAAKALAAKHPFVRDNTGKFFISVHELMHVPGM